jgi:hypothetical protein
LQSRNAIGEPPFYPHAALLPVPIEKKRSRAANLRKA